MRTILIRVLAAFAVTASLFAAPSPAHAGAVIKCKTLATYNPATGKTTARVRSNYPSKAAVHSYVFLFSNGDDIWSRTYDRGYGPALTIRGSAYQVYSYQSGTRCTPGGVRWAGAAAGRVSGATGR